MPRSRLPSFRFRPDRLLRLAVQSGAQATVGGQAVMEGVMMRSPGHWGVAIRRYNGEIVEVHRVHRSFASRHAWARLPLLRGVIALGDSLSIGMRALSVSAHYAAEAIEEEQQEGGHVPAVTAAEAIPIVVPMPRAGAHDVDVAGDAPSEDVPETERKGSDANPDTLKGWQVAIAIVFAFAFSIGLFKVLPWFLASFTGVGTHSLGFVLIESFIRIAIFIGYLALVGLMPDMRRVFEYHSAEHKAINAFEAGDDLSPAAVNRHSRIHVRCGTAFMLWVFVVAIVVFGVVQVVFPDASKLFLVASRIVLLPLIAGLSFELIRFAGKHPDNRLIRGVLAPGLWMQYLTTRPCNEEQCEVAIRALELVLGHEAQDAAGEAASGEDEGVAAQVMA